MARPTKTKLRDVMKKAKQYESKGMSRSEAMKKAWKD